MKKILLLPIAAISLQIHAWDNEYKVDSFPDQAYNWTFQGNYPTGRMVQNGVLEIDTVGSSARTHNYTSENILSVNDDITVEARLKVLNLSGAGSSCGIWIANGQNEEIVLFKSNGIYIMNANIHYNYPAGYTPKEFNTIKINKVNSDIIVYLNGLQVIEGLNSFTYPSSRNFVAFGDGGTLGSCKMNWDFVRYKINQYE